MILHSEEELVAQGAVLADKLRIGDKVSLAGTLGAGKTTFARGVLRGLGYEGDVPSPSFPIVQQYDPPDVSLRIAHVDFYRIEDPSEIEELGIDDMLYDGAIIAEWPDRMPDSFWQDALRIEIKIEQDNIRRLTWQAGAAWKDRWPPK